MAVVIVIAVLNTGEGQETNVDDHCSVQEYDANNHDNSKGKIHIRNNYYNAYAGNMNKDIPPLKVRIVLAEVTSAYLLLSASPSQRDSIVPRGKAISIIIVILMIVSLIIIVVICVIIRRIVT